MPETKAVLETQAEAAAAAVGEYVPGGVRDGTGEPFTVEVNVRLQAVAVREPDGRYSIIVPALPGCVSGADDIEQVQANVVEAAEGWLEVSHDHNKDEDIRLIRGSIRPKRARS